jgi:hypothetical protein
MYITREEKEQQLRKQRKWAHEYRNKNIKYNTMLEEQIEILRKENDNLKEGIESLQQEILLYTSQERIVNNAPQQIPAMLPLQGSQVLPEGFAQRSTFQPVYIGHLAPTMYAQDFQFLPHILPMQVPDPVTSGGTDTFDGVHENNIGFMPYQPEGPPENQDRGATASRFLDTTEDLHDRQSDMDAILDHYERSSSMASPGSYVGNRESRSQLQKNH